MIQRPRGTRDFGPAETHVRMVVAGRMQQVFRRFGYREVQTPTFEELELFTAKSGPSILDELYAFKDKGERDMCLRPELTAPVMRMYYESHFNDPKPLKWSYFGNCFRYDRPQAGRYREFWQFGCEQLGAGTPLAYAELLALADAVMRGVGLRERDFLVGHVRILRHCVDAFGFDAAARSAMMRAIDKRDDDEVRRLAGQMPGREGALDRLFRVMDAPNLAAARSALQLDGAAAGPDAEVGAAMAELDAVFAHLEGFGVANVKLNLGIARGLDYYTGIVFEMHCPILGAEKQLLGGGGYDLAKLFGGQTTATMGFGLGFDRTIVALEKQAEMDGKPFAFAPEAGPTAYVAGLGDAAVAKVVPIVATLRNAGVTVELDLLGRKPGAVAKHADAVGARFLVIVGEQELASGVANVKELSSGARVEVPLEKLVEHLKNMG